MFAYFIVYTFTQSGKCGNGNADVHLYGSINSINDIRAIESELAKKHEFDTCVIQSFQKF